ncbi:MAG: DUF4230 domain-containing protein [Ekhidna sp.]
MINLLKLLLKILPWLIVVGLLSWMLIQEKLGSVWVEGNKEVRQTTILTKVEQMGKLELVKYNFQEVSEVKKIADYIDLKLFKYKPVPDAKGVLISQGSAAGCIDLTKIQLTDIEEVNDTIYVTLPLPELCYFKIDLEKSRIYDLQVNYMQPDDQKKFVQELYKVSEEQIRATAMEKGILEQTKENAHSVLRPILENISSQKVMIRFGLNGQSIDSF